MAEDARPIVLIVDDVPDNLHLLADTLDEAGYTVLVATDGVQALERLDRIAPAVILLDAMMPGLDGFETCRRIKARADAADVPVIFMTGLAGSEDVVRGFEAGGIDYVTKPVRPEEVLARVAAHVRTARALRAAREAGPGGTPRRSLGDAGLTAREIEVLLWVAQGKTNRDVGDILGLSPRTVNKHLEHVFVKLGVETRTAAATIALQSVEMLRLRAEG